VPFQTVLVNHAIYINMIVPQAMEQLRLAVCKLLWPQGRSGVRVNNPLVADTLAYVVRIVTDKTGTITENRMVAKLQAVFGYVHARV
jgi:P-type E1-E2 ATPase